MNPNKFKKLYQHYVNHFGASEEPKIFHPNTPQGMPHIDVIRIMPTADRPFQVLATIGASDIKLKRVHGDLSSRNEYVTFLPADWDEKELPWVMNLLMATAVYPAVTGEDVSYSHTLDMADGFLARFQGDDFNMIGAGLLFPEACESTDVLRCRTGLLEIVTILHMMPLTRAEMNKIIARREKGEPDWSDMFYPEDDEAFGKMPFLCARKR